jgi:hypothetical protein
MNRDRFAVMSHSLMDRPSRRNVLRGLAAAGFRLGAVSAGASALAAARGLIDLGAGGEVEARKRRKRRKRCGKGGSCRVFVSGTFYGGNLGGLTGADSICQSLAQAAGLPGTYKAWLSDSTASPSTRFVRSTGPYRLVGGNKVADNWTDLTNGSLDVPIIVTEMGAAVASGTAVWTHTQPNGAALASANHCGNWGTATGDGDVGDLAASNATWTVDETLACNSEGRLYCFQQG